MRARLPHHVPACRPLRTAAAVVSNAWGDRTARARPSVLEAGAVPLNPYQQYRATKVETAGSVDLVVMLYQGAVRFIRLGIEAIERDDGEGGAQEPRARPGHRRRAARLAQPRGRRPDRRPARQRLRLLLPSARHRQREEGSRAGPRGGPHPPRPRVPPGRRSPPSSGRLRARARRLRSAACRSHGPSDAVLQPLLARRRSATCWPGCGSCSRCRPTH